jgi:hypothetical protein
MHKERPSETAAVRRSFWKEMGLIELGLGVDQNSTDATMPLCQARERG